MIRAVLFDMGGTLDGDGQHWLERFWALYTALDVRVSREAVRAAFDAAEARAAVDEHAASSGLVTMVKQHVDWQFAHLGLSGDDSLRDRMVAAFVGPVWDAAAVNARLLAELHSAGLRLGVVSNGVGNVETLCREMGYTPFLSAVVDSHWVGISKPDPAIFLLAADRLACPPDTVMMVGDSFDRDVRPARAVGMRTAWLQGTEPRSCPDPSAVDVYLTTLADLPEALGLPERLRA